MTSVSDKKPNDGLILSNTIRIGIVGLAKTLSNELALYNITVNNICPSHTMTERIQTLSAEVAGKKGISSDEVIRDWESQIPMGRMGEPEEIAALAVFLASARASSLRNPGPRKMAER